MNDGNSALLTDLYQLTMLQSYHRESMDDTAVFELFVRKLPAARHFLLAAGLEQVLAYLEQFRFSPEECNWLAHTGRFDPAFVDYLAEMRFTGEAHAVPEGTVFFPDEPVLRITAPLPEAQIVETRIINLIQFQTMIASKAVRSVLAAPGKLLVDFGLRRAHGAEAGVLAARAGYIAGLAGSSNVLTCKTLGIPMYGTMAHSYIMAHDDESLSFEHFARSHPKDVVLLIDTYDTERGAAKVTELAPALAKYGAEVKAVRLDSGDLLALSKSVRGILDRGGLSQTGIFASGDLDEYEVQRLLQNGAPIDGFGIGTRLITSADHPYLNCAYKLQEYAGKPRRKYSSGKQTWPGRKQVYRNYSDDGIMQYDILTLENDKRDGTPLLIPVMRGGKRLDAAESLEQIRRRCAEQIAAFPENLRSLEGPADYPVKIGEPLNALAEQMEKQAFPS